MSIVKLTLRLNTEKSDQLRVLNWLRDTDGSVQYLVCKAVNSYIDTLQEDDFIKQFGEKIVAEIKTRLESMVFIPVPADPNQNQNIPETVSNKEPTEEELEKNKETVMEFLSALYD